MFAVSRVKTFVIPSFFQIITLIQSFLNCQLPDSLIIFLKKVNSQ
jgi:hypothetical protein